MSYNLESNLIEDFISLRDTLTLAEKKWLELGRKDEKVEHLIWECNNRLKSFLRDMDKAINLSKEYPNNRRDYELEFYEKSNIILKEISKIPKK